MRLFDVAFHVSDANNARATSACRNGRIDEYSMSMVCRRACRTATRRWHARPQEERHRPRSAGVHRHRLHDLFLLPPGGSATIAVSREASRGSPGTRGVLLRSTLMPRKPAHRHPRPQSVDELGVGSLERFSLSCRRGSWALVARPTPSPQHPSRQTPRRPPCREPSCCGRQRGLESMRLRASAIADGDGAQSAGCATKVANRQTKSATSRRRGWRR